jgi:hypothetical protein
VATHHQSESGPGAERECGDEVHILGKKIKSFWPFLDGLVLAVAHLFGFYNPKQLADFLEVPHQQFYTVEVISL